MSAYVLVLANQKGGVCKTTTATVTADILMKRGKRVLLIDTDPQRNASDTYNAQVEDAPTLYDVLYAQESVRDCIQHTEAGDILASEPSLYTADMDLANIPNRYFVLKNAIQEVKDDYDYIIIDTSTHLGFLFFNALQCADGVIIPATADRYTLQGISYLVSTIQTIKKMGNPKLELLGLLRVKFDRRLNIHRAGEQVFYETAKQLGIRVFDSFIRNNVAVQESQAYRRLLSFYSKKANAYNDYQAFVAELQQMIERS